MNKIVPDPPTLLFGKTANQSCGTSDNGRPPPFTGRAGIDARDALVHASLLLAGSHDTVQQACSGPDDQVRKDLLWVSLHSAGMAKWLVDAVIDGMEVSATLIA